MWSPCDTHLILKRLSSAILTANCICERKNIHHCYVSIRKIAMEQNHLNRTFIWIEHFEKKKKSSISFIQKNLFIHLTVWFVHVLRLASKTCAIALMQAGFQANQFASIIDRTDKITNFTKNHARKSFFFFRRLKRDFHLNFCICHKKSKIMNSKKKNLLVLFIHKIHVILFSKVLKTFKFKLFSSF